MLFFLYGYDTYRMKQKLDEIWQTLARQSNGLVVKYIDCASSSAQDVISELKTRDLFRGNRTIVLQRVFADRPLMEYFFSCGRELQSYRNLILVIYEAGQPAKGDQFFKFLCGLAKTYYFPLLKGKALVTWIEQEVKRCGGQISPQGAFCLAHFIGSDLRMQSMEIKKLVALKGGKEIDEKDVLYCLKPEPEKAIFQLLDALVERRKAMALKLLHAHLLNGDSPQYLLSMIAFQIRSLILLKDSQERGSRSLGDLKPYTIKKLTPLARRFSLPELKKIYRKIFEADLDIKTGKMTSAIALELLIAEI